MEAKDGAGRISRERLARKIREFLKAYRRRTPASGELCRRLADECESAAAGLDPALDQVWVNLPTEPKPTRRLTCKGQARLGSEEELALSHNCFFVRDACGDYLRGRALSAETLTELEAVAAEMQRTGRAKRPAHRPRAYDPKRDAKLVRDWKASGMRQAEFEEELRLEPESVRKAKDRLRSAARRERETQGD